MPRRKILYYDPILKERARKLRNGCTPAEARLWPSLKGKQMQGFDFHRQKPIDHFICDFYCCELLLAIELDGGMHDLPHVQERDQRKEERLAGYGITLLRFKNEQVFEDLDGVLREIREAVDQIVARDPGRLPGLIY